ncbi:MAG: hypothetical protein WDN69_34070 [Aliidongia sp.]
MAIERHYRVLSHINFHYGPLLALRPRALGPGRQDHRATVLEAARRVVQPGAGLCFLGHAARSLGHGRRRGALPGAGFPRDEDSLPPRRLARRRHGARSGAQARRQTGSS